MVMLYAKNIKQLSKKISIHFSMKDINKLIILLTQEVNKKETNNNRLLFKKGK
jgi:hypothetical protein